MLKRDGKTCEGEWVWQGGKAACHWVGMGALISSSASRLNRRGICKKQKNTVFIRKITIVHCVFLKHQPLGILLQCRFWLWDQEPNTVFAVTPG